MDGSFVAKSRVPDVSPQESFFCSLGVDPSVRITFHPQKKIKSSTGGGLLSSKSSVTQFRQRITIKNTRSTSIARLVVRDLVPLSEDARIKLTMISPPEKAIGPAVPSVVNASGSGAIGTFKGADVAETLTAQIEKGVVARWAQKDDEGGGSGGSREDGVIEWIGTDIKDVLNLELVYEVTAPADLAWTNV
jgi:hypothetical protein